MGPGHVLRILRLGKGSLGRGPGFVALALAASLSACGGASRSGGTGPSVAELAAPASERPEDPRATCPSGQTCVVYDAAGSRWLARDGRVRPLSEPAAVAADADGGRIVIHADPSAGAGAVLDLVAGLFAADAMMARVVVGSRSLDLEPAPLEPPTREHLDLGVVVLGAGVGVWGSGGWLAPGCEETSASRAVTVPAGDTERRALAGCLNEVRGLFPDQRDARLVAEGDVSIERVVELGAVVGAADRFPVLYLGRSVGPSPLPPASEPLDASAAPRSSLSSYLGVMQAVGRALRSQLREHQPCLQAALSEGGVQVPATIEVRLTVTPSGETEDVAVASNGSGNAALARCVVRATEQLRLEEGPAEPVTFTYPFELRPPPGRRAAPAP